MLDREILENTRKVLRYADGPLKRRELIQAVIFRTRPHGWSVTTWARRIREAINALIADGVPVVSDGHGFRIAQSREEEQIPLRLLEKQIRSLTVKYHRLTGIPFGQIHEQLGLFDSSEGTA